MYVISLHTINHRGNILRDTIAVVESESEESVL